MNAEFLLGQGDQPLLFRKWTDNRRRNGKRPAVFLGHSQPTHSGMLHDLAHAFCQKGWDAYSGDVRGHGQSTKQDMPLGHMSQENGWQCAVDDMRLFFEKSFEGVSWENRLIVVPNITALMTLEVLKTWPDLAQHIVLISPPPNQPSLALFGRTFSKVRLKTRPADRPDEQSLHHLYAFLGSHLKNRRHPADVMSADRRIIENIIADPLGWPVPSPAYWYNIFSGMLSAWKWPKGVQVKPGTRCLALYGGEDAMMRDGGFLPPIERFLERAGMDNIASASIEGGRSALFLEEKRLGITDRILQWLGEQWIPDEENAELSVTDIANELLAMTSVAGRTHEVSPSEMVELCYNAIDDETRWTEIIYRMICETERSGEMAEEELHRLIMNLMPHWERSFNLNKQVMMNATLGVLLQSVIERLHIGVAVLDRDGELLHSNKAYFEALSRMFGTDTQPGSDEDLASRYTQKLLQEEKSAATSGETLLIHNDQPVGFRFHPEALNQTVLQHHKPASVLVLRNTTHRKIDPDSRLVLTELAYDLTRKEAEIVLMIAAGKSPEETADLLGIMVSTVRSHLKKAYSKMDLHSQSEITARILSGPIGWLE